MTFTRTSGSLTATGGIDTMIDDTNTAVTHYNFKFTPETFYQGDSFQYLVEEYYDDISEYRGYELHKVNYSDIKPENMEFGNLNDYLVNLIARWTFDSTLADSEGSENLVDNASIAYDTTDKIVGTAAADFDGTTDYLTTPNDEPFDFEYTTPFTLSGWVNTSSLVSNQVLWAKGTNIASGGSAGYYVYVNTSGNIIFRFTDTSLNDFSITSATALSISKWYHISVTYDGSSNRSGMKIYLNGSLDQTGTASTISISILNASSLSIGAESDGGAKFTGSQDDVRVYNINISANAVRAVYVKQRSLVAHLKFENNVTDSSGNGSNGTVTNETIFSNGIVGKRAFQFINNNYITLANESNFDFEYNDAKSFSFWFKTSSAAAAQYFIQKGETAGTFKRFLVFMGSGKISYLMQNTGTGYLEVDSVSTYNNGSWYHCVVTDAGTGATGVKIYINGATVSTTTVSNTLSSTILTNNSLIIGADSAGTNDFTGSLDEVKIWNYELSADEVLKEAGRKCGSIYLPLTQGLRYRVKLQDTSPTPRTYRFERIEIQ
jgi:hypothetical protein